MRRILGLLTALVLTGLVVLTAVRFLHTGFGPAVQLASFSSYAVVGFVVVLLGCALALLAVHTSQPVVAPRPWLADMDRVRERAALAVAQGPTLVLGDFNATRDHEPLRAVLRAGLRDAAEAAGSGWQPTWPTRYRESWLRPLVAIDHVLISAEYDAIRTHTVEVSDTDHLAVVATLRLRNGD